MATDRERAPRWNDLLGLLDELGYTINTASFGAGDWQYTATDYDDLGNTTRTLDVRGARAVLSGAAVADQAASYTFYNGDLSGTTSTTTGGTTTSSTGVVTPKGTLVVETLGPARTATVPDTTTGAPAGATVQRLVRPRTHTDYDQGAPTSSTAAPAVEGQTTGAGINPATGMPYRLATTTTTTAVDASATASSGGAGATLTGDLTALDTVSVTRNGYAKGATTSADGWALGAPVTVTTKMGTGNTGDDIVKTTIYDDEGTVLSTSQLQ